MKMNEGSNTFSNELISLSNSLGMIKGDGKLVHKIANIRSILIATADALEKTNDNKIILRLKSNVQKSIDTGNEILKEVSMELPTNASNGRKKNSSLIGVFHQMGKSESKTKIAKKIISNVNDISSHLNNKE